MGRESRAEIFSWKSPYVHCKFEMILFRQHFTKLKAKKHCWSVPSQTTCMTAPKATHISVSDNRNYLGKLREKMAFVVSEDRQFTRPQDVFCEEKITRGCISSLHHLPYLCCMLHIKKNTCLKLKIRLMNYIF